MNLFYEATKNFLLATKKWPNPRSAIRKDLIQSMAPTLQIS
jgi:hypothetical protein